MNFMDHYPRLFQFLAGYFPDSDFDNLSDEEIIKEYLSICDSDRLSQILIELDDLITKVNTFWKEVSYITNIYFETEEATLEWLLFVQKSLSNS